MKRIIFLALLLVATNAQEKYKLCATDKISEDACSALKRGGSKVSCLRVTDSADCAIQLYEEKADFGVFNAEELILAHQFYPVQIAPIFQLKHRDRTNESFEFQSVAVVPITFTPVGHANDFENLRGGGLCHPGFSSAQWWNDYIMKYFERKVAASVCQNNLTAAENEVQNIKNFFGKACRPGEWSADDSYDAVLKNKHPELCELCDNKESCRYSNGDKHGHIGALDCLTSGRGKVAYVALTYVREYFKSNDSYQFLCSDGTVQPLSVETPCAWIQQPWSAIVARRPIASTLTESLKEWLVPTYANDPWIVSLQKILQDDVNALPLTENTSTATYLSKGREVDLPNAAMCKQDPIRWCTIGHMETQKCKWVSKEAEALGIEPKISCHKTDSTFQCFRDIAQRNADVMTIDSNYGHLARTVFGLTSVLYSETESDRNSVVVAVTRERSDNPITSLESLKGRKACFPEYGGIAWLSFSNVARTNGIISSKSCDYSKLVADFFSGACTPGMRDNDHANQTVSPQRPVITDILCSACPVTENNTFCGVGKGNPYYGDYGALTCLKNGDGDVAFVEIQNLRDLDLNPKEYRILCKNGSLASAPGFTVDEFCPLSITIDSEIVGRKNSTDIEALDAALALLKIENWLGYRVEAHRPIRIYDSFNGTKDLLFKDSSSGLVNVTSSLQTVLAYKDLFSHVETCSAASLSVIANLNLIAVVIISTFFFSRVV